MEHEDHIIRGVDANGSEAYLCPGSVLSEDRNKAMIVNNKTGARERALNLNRLLVYPSYRFIAVPLSSFENE